SPKRRLLPNQLDVAAPVGNGRPRRDDAENSYCNSQGFPKADERLMRHAGIRNTEDGDQKHRDVGQLPPQKAFLPQPRRLDGRLGIGGLAHIATHFSNETGSVSMADGDGVPHSAADYGLILDAQPGGTRYRSQRPLLRTRYV